MVSWSIQSDKDQELRIGVEYPKRGGPGTQRFVLVFNVFPIRFVGTIHDWWCRATLLVKVIEKSWR